MQVASSNSHYGGARTMGRGGTRPSRRNTQGIDRGRDSALVCAAPPSGRVENWRAHLRLRWCFHSFRSGPQSGCHHVSSRDISLCAGAEWTSNEGHMVRALGRQRSDLQPILNELFVTLSQADQLGFNPLVRIYEGTVCQIKDRTRAKVSLSQGAGPLP